MLRPPSQCRATRGRTSPQSLPVPSHSTALVSILTIGAALLGEVPQHRQAHTGQRGKRWLRPKVRLQPAHLWLAFVSDSSAYWQKGFLLKQNEKLDRVCMFA